MILVVLLGLMLLAALAVGVGVVLYFALRKKQSETPVQPAAKPPVLPGQ